MVFKLPPPPPSNDIKGSAWQDWFYKITKALGSVLHNDLTDLQGGTAGQYYHLTAAQLTDLTDAGDSILHFHASDRDSANFTGTTWTDLTDGGLTTLHTHDHDNLSGLQGGTAGEYFHLTSAEYTGLVSDIYAFAAAQG